MSEIELLARKVAALSSAASFWNKAMLYSLGAAAVVALLIALTTRLAIVRTDDLSDAKTELADAKDHQFALDLKEKEGKIIDLGNANVSLRNDLERSTAESRAKQTELEKEQQKTALAQKAAADSEFALRRASAFAAAPRRIIAVNRDGDEKIRADKFREVSQYANTRLVIVFVRDEEAEILAYSIGRALVEMARWSNVSVVARESTPIPVGYITEGVQVHTFLTVDNSPVTALPPPGSAPPPIWTALFELLNLDLGQDRTGAPFGVTWSPDGIINGVPMGLPRYGFNFPKDGVVITVGRKPVEQIFRFLPESIQAEAQKHSSSDPKAK